MILDDGGDATLLLYLGSKAETGPSVLDNPGSEEEVALFNSQARELASNLSILEQQTAQNRQELAEMGIPSRGHQPKDLEYLAGQGFEISPHLVEPPIAQQRVEILAIAGELHEPGQVVDAAHPPAQLLVGDIQIPGQLT